jgi:hypothetical protein
MGAESYSLQRVDTEVSCERCGRVLRGDDAAIRCDRPWIVGADASFRCGTCALDCDVRALRDSLLASALMFDQRSALESAVAERLRAIAARARGKFAPCTPARDREGRPRVRVLIHGLVISRVSVTGKAFWSQLRAGCAFSSARREYAFEAPAGDDSLRGYDPAQPLVAYVYGLNARPADVLTQSRDDRTLRECKERGFPPPLLWLQGVSERAARDKHVPRAREIVERAGFEADHCPTLCCKSMSRAAVEALVEALDEHFDGTEIAANVR